MIRNCRFCHSPLHHVFADLGMSPLSNSFLSSNDLNKMEAFFPLRVFVCEYCFLVQLEEFESPSNIFSDYAYFSSYSKSWLAHAKKYTDYVTKRFNLCKQNRIIEIASNDGYLLQYFKEKGITALGIEPAINVAEAAKMKGINTITEFFNSTLAQKLADKNTTGHLVLGNNVLAHVPNLNDFVLGLKIVLHDQGIITMEFPHVLNLIEHNQFDTIYHEHFSYFSLISVINVFSKHQLRIFDVEKLSTHGGSLRIFATHSQSKSHPTETSVREILREEKNAKLKKLETYLNFRQTSYQLKNNLLSCLIELKEKGHSIAAYGAPAKGNTLLNYCGIKEDTISFTVDQNPYKQNLFLPGTHIPIHHPDYIFASKPDYILVLPWNLKHEIAEQLQPAKEWGCKLIIPIPEVDIIDDF